jgi:hypothetical protein
MGAHQSKSALTVFNGILWLGKLGQSGGSHGKGKGWDESVDGNAK